ncbi:MAG: hypothetical protein WC359_12525 [Dehalococcoidia bacterium]|jgi:hypothetical protein
MAKVMDLFEYRTVDTSTTEGLDRAEKLKETGWEIYSVGLYIVQFYRKVGVINDAS